MPTAIANFRRVRDGVQDGLAQVGQHEDGHEQALHDHGRHRRLPAEAEAQIRVKATTALRPSPEARATGKFATRPIAMLAAAAAMQVAKNTPGIGEPRPLGAEYVRVDEDDVGHRHEGRQPRDHLRPEVRPPLREPEERPKIHSLCRAAATRRQFSIVKPQVSGFRSGLQIVDSLRQRLSVVVASVVDRPELDASAQKGLFLFQTSQAMERTQSPMMAE